MELELKFKCHKINQLRSKILAKGFTFVSKRHIIDTYFIINKKTDEERDYLRIREDKHKNSVSIDYHKVKSLLETEEHEITVDDKIQAEKILEGLGCTLLCIIDKIRETYSKDGIKLVLDDVKKLGRFVEIEMEGEMSDDNSTRLENISRELGLKEDQRVTKKGYPDLFIEAGYNP